MKLSLKELVGYNVLTFDGVKGSVQDFLIDQNQWFIRYADIDLGFILPDRRVLIPKTFLKGIYPRWKEFRVELSKEGLELCPPLEEKLPVCREYEAQLNRYYRIADYWKHTYQEPKDTYGKMYHIDAHDKDVKVPTKIIAEEDTLSNLRSWKEIRGYKVMAGDEQLGIINDLILDDFDYQIVGVIVDTNSWQPWSKCIMVGVEYIKEISYVNQLISLTLTTISADSFPEFNPLDPVNVIYEKHYYNYLGMPVN